MYRLPLRKFRLTDYVNDTHLPGGNIDIPLENGRLMYDLFAVDNHSGTLLGGHYTAYAKNYKDGKWYSFNDSFVTPVSNLSEIVSG